MQDDTEDPCEAKAQALARKAAEIELAWQLHITRTAATEWQALRRRLSAEQNHRCCYCGVRTDASSRHPPTIEHVIPRSLGGPDTYDNCVMVCAACNTERGNVMRDEHAAVLGYIGVSLP
ncbi:MAG: HNH endonuclease [Roseococcus sp.]